MGGRGRTMGGRGRTREVGVGPGFWFFLSRRLCKNEKPGLTQTGVTGSTQNIRT